LPPTEQAPVSKPQPEGLGKTSVKGGNPHGFLKDQNELGPAGVPDLGTTGVAGFTGMTQEELELSYPTTDNFDRKLQKIEDLSGTKEWAMTRIPDFKGLKALILPGAFYGSVVGLMAEAGFIKATSLDEADVVVFAGGADVNPALYNEKAMACTSFHATRDQEEQRVYHAARRLGLPMFGICRGAQFLHVMNGGQLWQNVNNHAGPDHEIYDIDEDVTVVVTSYHHQMLIDHKDLNVIACCNKQIATRFEQASFTVDLKKEGPEAASELEIEAGSYPTTKCFFVQGHPEVGSREYRSWTMTKLWDFLSEWGVFARQEERLRQSVTMGFDVVGGVTPPHSAAA
jgi:gamma-glutamyl-gamma-aminobutyrate hydrolase PuuD